MTARMAGSVLHAWAFLRGAKKQDGSKNTAEVWALLKEAYKDLGIKEKFNNLVVSMFTNHEKPWSQPAKLKGHAGEIRHLAPALALVAWKKANECEGFL